MAVPTSKQWVSILSHTPSMIKHETTSQYLSWSFFLCQCLCQVSHLPARWQPEPNIHWYCHGNQGTELNTLVLPWSQSKELNTQIIHMYTCWCIKSPWCGHHKRGYSVKCSHTNIRTCVHAYAVLTFVAALGHHPEGESEGSIGHRKPSYSQNFLSPPYLVSQL